MRERTRELGLLIIGDVFCFIAALYITLAARYLALPSQELLRIHLIPFLIFTGLWILVFFISGLYDKQTRVARLHMMGRIVYAQFVNILIALVLFFVLPFGISPTTNLLIYLFVSIALISAWRTYLYPWLDGARRKRMSALLIASGTEAHELLHEINENNRFNYRIVHHIDPENSMRDFKTVYEETFDRVPLATVERDWITYHCADRDSLMYTVSKRLIDIVGSSILLLFFALLLPFIALAIKLDSKGPVFITQDRIGKNGRRLRVWKLRTMTQSESTSGLFFKENTTNVSRR